MRKITENLSSSEGGGMIRNSEIAAVADALADQCEHVSVALLGLPSSASGRELRFGSHGSFALRREGAKRGRWSLLSFHCNVYNPMCRVLGRRQFLGVLR